MIDLYLLEELDFLVSFSFFSTCSLLAYMSYL